MTYEQLQAANAEIETLPIQGKEYATVPERVKAFRKLYPEGFIKTNINIEDKTCVVHATVGFYESGLEHVLGEGTGREVEGSSYINRGSYVENAETSAIGRALGFVGLLGVASVASFEEVANAKLNSEEEKTKEDPGKKKITEEQIYGLINLAGRDDVSMTHIRNLCKVREIRDLTQKQYKNIMDNWDKVKEGQR